MLANLDPVSWVGIANALADDGIEVLGAERAGDAIVLTAGELRPDAIVVGAAGGTDALGARLHMALPEAKLIFLTRDEGGSRILDPGGEAARPIRPPVIDALRSELSDCATKPEETDA
jgi:hypothetical protein